ncbi:hypothetical protein ACRCJW_09315 [Aerococcus urinaeequi]|nr:MULTISPECIES: hypothetical protein [Lactobacillales]MDT2761511.1 hypothetical protein [Aerococcus urinaeequi]BDX42380.1 hypothetical protein K6D_24540 [Enterococcus faecium]
MIMNLKIVYMIDIQIQKLEENNLKTPVFNKARFIDISMWEQTCIFSLKEMDNKNALSIQTGINKRLIPLVSRK